MAQAQLALTGFPVDADLPTLPRAMDPDVLRGVASNAHGGSRPAVEVAHRPREGACVLRYRFTPEDRSAPHGEPGRTLYGKVYADDSGQRVDGYLRALARDRSAGIAAVGAVPDVGRLRPATSASSSPRSWQGRPSYRGC